MDVVFLAANWRVFLKNTIKYSFKQKEDSFTWNLWIIHWAKKKEAIPQQKYKSTQHCSRSRLESREWRQKILLLSQSTRPKDRNSRSRLEARDQKTEILDLVSKNETERQKFSISSRSMRLKGRNSRSRLESWKMHLVMLWFHLIGV